MGVVISESTLYKACDHAHELLVACKPSGVAVAIIRGSTVTHGSNFAYTSSTVHFFQLFHLFPPDTLFVLFVNTTTTVLFGQQASCIP